jgi:hypothetical protein
MGLGDRIDVFFHPFSDFYSRFSSRTVSDNPPRHSGVGFRRDF